MLTVNPFEGIIVGMATPASRKSRLQLAVAAWLKTFRSDNTRAAYSADFRHFGAWCGEHDVDALALDEDDLQRYRADCEADGAGTATVARRLSAIASFGAFAFGAGRAGAPPHVDRPELAAQSSADLLSDHDAGALLAAADRTNPQSAALIRLLMLDGLKVGEAVRADATDLTGRPPRMSLKLGHPASRVVSLHPDTAAAVHSYVARRREGPLLLSAHRGARARLTRFGIDYLVKQAAEAAGLARTVSGNTLRRRYVVAAHERGDHMDDIRRNAGHSDERTTRRYLP
jgi:integrase/recombinase XerD